MRVCRPASVSMVTDCADRVAIALRASQAERNRGRQILHYVLQEPQLGSIAVLKTHFEPAIVIEIGEGK